MTTKESIAAALTGCFHPFIVPDGIAERAKNAGMLIIFIVDVDDKMKMRGAFKAELSGYHGGTANLNRDGLVDLEPAETDPSDGYIRRRLSRSVKSVWDDENDAWVYETDIPHVRFSSADDGYEWCSGIVIDIADLPEAQRAGEPA